MSDSNKHIELDGYAEDCIRIAARNLIHKIKSPAISKEDLEQELRIDLLCRLEHFDPDQVSYKTFCSKIVRNHAFTLLRKHTSKENFEVCSLQDPLEQDYENCAERIETIDQQDWQREVSKKEKASHELGEMSTDADRIIKELPQHLSSLCDQLQTKSVTEISRELNMPRGTLYEHINKLREIFAVIQFSKDDDHFRRFLDSFSKYPRKRKRKNQSDSGRDMKKNKKNKRAISTLTFSQLKTFIACREACRLRYFEHLVPLEKDVFLSFGSLIHRCLEIWYLEHDLFAVMRHIDEKLPLRDSDLAQKQQWHMARAMMTGYALRYPTEDFEVVAIEKQFEGKITNPETGASSRSFVMQGVIDGIVRKGDEYFILEHKTASSVDGSYLERLWNDMQISIYSLYAQEALNIPISGVIYNVLIKPRLKQREGETQEQFELRRDELAKRNKNGRSSAKRQLPESDEEFQARLVAKCSEPEMFHREVLYLSQNQLEQTKRDIWELCHQLNDARRRNTFSRNTAHCYHYRRPCEYYPLCESNGDEVIVQNLYERVLPHPELRRAHESINNQKNEENDHEVA